MFRRRGLIGMMGKTPLPSFNLLQTYIQNDAKPYSSWAGLAVGDVDGDGNLEIVAVGEYGRIVIYRMFAGGVIEVGWCKSLLLSLECVAIEDINNDGTKEIVVSGFSHGASPNIGVEIWTWNGTTSTKTYSSYMTGNSAVHSWMLVVGHLAGDATWQIAFAEDDDSTNLNQIYRIYNADLSAYTETTVTHLHSPNTWTQPGIIGDVDGDSAIELVTFGRDDQVTACAVAHIWSWDGTALTLKKTITNNVESEWHGGLLVDINGDGTNEIVVSGYKVVGGIHKAWLKVFTLDFASVLSEYLWSYNNVDTEVWYMRTNLLTGSGTIPDITCYGGSYGYGSQFISLFRYRNNIFTPLFENPFSALGGANTHMVLETGWLGDLNGDGALEAITFGWWQNVNDMRVQFINHAPPTPAAGWWSTGGIDSCVQALAPKGAASYAASLLDLSGNGNNAATGSLPGWNATDGWIFSSTKYIDSNVLAYKVQTFIIRFSGVGAQANNILVGVTSAIGKIGKIQIYPYATDNKTYYDNGGNIGAREIAVTPGTFSGVLAIAGNYAYKNGTQDGGAIDGQGSEHPALNIYIGATNQNGSPALYTIGNVQAYAAYAGVLTPAQVAALSTAMAAL